MKTRRRENGDEKWVLSTMRNISIIIIIILIIFTVMIYVVMKCNRYVSYVGNGVTLHNVNYSRVVLLDLYIICSCLIIGGAGFLRLTS